eukprot:574582-Amphidinium_carterae.1
MLLSGSTMGYGSCGCSGCASQPRAYHIRFALSAWQLYFSVALCIQTGLCSGRLLWSVNACGLSFLTH